MNFDLSCFNNDFQNFVFKQLNCENYFDFINKYENSFTLNINSKCSNETPKENISLNTETLIQKEEIVEDKPYKYFIENDKLYLKTPENISKNRKKKFRENEGLFLKNSDCWVFPLSFKNYLLEIINPLNETFEVLEEDDKEELKTENIQKFYFQDNKAFLIPTTEHPQYGKGVIYDKTGNMGIWSVKNKGWIFQKENH